MSKERKYFIFANKPQGEYQDSFWDTRMILKTNEYYFEISDKSTFRPQKDDIVIFKEFRSMKYWGEAVIDFEREEIVKDGEKVILFRLKNLKKWLYTINTGSVYNELSNKDTRARIVSITQQDYNLIITKMKQNRVLSEEREMQIKNLWSNFIQNIQDSERAQKEKNITKIKEDWQQYRLKILNGSFLLDDYTNTLDNIGSTQTLPGGYLCNFLERTTSDIMGSSKPGNSFRFGIKLNNDNVTYTIDTNPKISKPEAEKKFNDDIKKLITDVTKTQNINEKIEIVEKRDTLIKAKQILRKLVVLDNTLDFIHVYSDDVIESLYDEFVGGSETENLSKNKAVLTVVKELFGLDNGISLADSYYISAFLWKYHNAKAIADENSPNVILYGPPGTGKTFTVKNNLDFVCQGDRNRYEFVQFHPSYTYEDFIEGIKPKGISADGNIKFELVNGVFKRFCIKAKNNPHNNYYFVIDEINRANLSSVFGEILLCLEKDYRHDVKDTKNPNNLSNLVKTQYSSLIEQLSPENKKELSYYLSEQGESYFGVPNNVFFIGMMNDVDKSIDAFDLALRRRFRWERKDCDYEIIVNETKFKNREDFENINDYIIACENLNNYISKDLCLGKSYEFGHSFFMKMSVISKRKVISKRNIEELFNLHLRPTLKEYIRAIYAENELDDCLKNAKLKFEEKFK